MDITEITSAITSVGFPIVACGALFWMIVQDRKSQKEESAATRTAINELTIAVTKLTERLGGTQAR